MAWQPTPVFLPGESQGRRSLGVCCLWGRTESDTTEVTQQQQQQQSKYDFPGSSDSKDSLVAQMVKNLPAMEETQVLSLGWEDRLEKEMETQSNLLTWRIPQTEEPGGLSPWSRKESDTTKQLKLSLHFQST